MSQLERHRWGWGSQARGARGEKVVAERRARRPSLEHLESRQLLSSISVFPLPANNALPGDIVVGPDGNLWFTEDVNHAIGTINPATHVITEIPLPGELAGPSPYGLTAGPDGNIWFTDPSNDSI